MSKKQLEIFRLEDRVLFEAAAAAEIVEAQENDPNANMNQADQQAQDAKNAIKNAPPENPSEQMAQADMPAPSDLSDIDAEIQALIEGEIGMGEVPEAMQDAINELLNGFGANAVSDAIDDAFTTDETLSVVANYDANISVGVEHELVIISGTVGGKDQIIASLGDNQEVLILENGADPYEQISAYLEASGNKYSALHIVSHGTDGILSLNGQGISADHFNADFWAGVGSHIAENGDIMLYGCNIAGSEAGQHFVDMIADAAGADVAASINATGLAGDWILEYSTGAIETTTLYVDAYEHSLQTYEVVNANDVASGDAGYAGSLRWAVASSVDSSGDEIIFNIAGNDTIVLKSAISITDKNITINGNNIATGNDVTIKVQVTYAEDAGAASDYRVFTIDGSSIVTIQNATLEGGGLTNVDGGTIHLSGTASLTLDNVEVAGSKARYGGGIYSSSTGLLTLTGSTVFNTHADTDGGGLFLRGASAILNGGTFTGNSAVRDGGGAFAHLGSALTVNGTKFTSNNAQHGGGIAGTGTDTNITIITLNGATIGGSLTKGNTATQGAGVYVWAATTLNILGDTEISYNTATDFGGGVTLLSSATANFSSGVVKNNNGGTAGGGFYLLGMSSAGVDYVPTLNLLGGVIGGADDSGNRANLAGGIYVGFGVLNVTNNSEISYNTATGSVGGGIWAVTNSAVNLTYGRIIYNKAATNAGGVGVNIGSNVTVSNNFTIGYNTAGASGGGIYGEQSGTTVTINGGIITGNTAKEGGGIFVGTYSALTMTGGTISCNTASTNGGGIVVAALSAADISGGTISGNIASRNGGGIALDAGITVSISGGTISGNFAGTDVTDSDLASSTGGFGGGIYSEVALTISGVTISNNIARSSSINTYGAGGGVFASVSLNASNSIFTGNSASIMGGGIYAPTLNLSGTNTFTSNEVIQPDTGTFAYGGAIFAGGTLTITGTSTFTNNKVQGGESQFARGGAIYAGTNTNITGATFIGNTAGDPALDNLKGQGGAIYSGGGLTITGSTFTENVASSEGGAVWMGALGSLNISGSTFARNRAAVDSSLAAVTAGGAIYSKGAITVATTAFTGNYASATGADGTAETARGGAIYAERTLTANAGVSFNGNRAYAWNSSDLTAGEIIAEGGAIYALGTVQFNSPATFSGNYAEARGYALNDTATVSRARGGAIYAATNITLTNMTFTGNYAKGSGAISDVHGGAVYAAANATLSGGFFGLDGDAATGNYVERVVGVPSSDGGAAYGGGIYIAGIGKVTGTHFTGNTAISGGNISLEAAGGAIYAAGPLTVNGATLFSENSAIQPNVGGSVYGGAIYAVSDLTITTGARFEYNKLVSGGSQDAYGGAIYVGGTGTISGATFTGNIADDQITGNPRGRGGAIYGDSKLIITDTVFTGNIAAYEGGAIWANGELYLTNAEFYGNNSGVGGALFLTDKTVITDSQFGKADLTEGNYAKQGGAIMIRSSEPRLIDLTIDGSEFYANYTVHNGNGDSSGGAIYISSGLSEITMNIIGDSRFEANYNVNGRDASGGGAIFIYSTGAGALVTLNINGNTQFVNNNSSGPGGAIDLGANSATANLKLNIGTLAGSTVSFAGNRASGAGGAVYAGSNGINTVQVGTAGAVTFTGNTATSRGGGMYVYSYTGTVDMTIGAGSKFSKNVGSGAGAIYAASDTGTTMLTVGVTGGSKVIFSENEARTDEGGAITSAGTVKIYNAEFDLNTAGNNGGALTMLYGNAILEVHDSAFTNNQAKAGNGGAIQVKSAASIGIYGNSKFVNNTAAEDGGAIWVKSSGVFALTLGNTIAGTVLFDTNTAKNNGGAVYMEANGSSSTLNIISANFTGNRAGTTGKGYAGRNGYGGAVYTVSAGTLSATVGSVAGGTVSFTGNKATYSGGAMYLYSSSSATVDIVNAAFSKNEATEYDYMGSGGAMYLRAAVNVDLNIGGVTGGSVTVADSKAIYFGAGLYLVGGSGTMNVNIGKAGSVAFTGNDISGGWNGGAIAATSSGGKMTFDVNGTFTNNKAGDSGGALWIRGTGAATDIEVSLAGTYTTNTTRNGSGGAIWIDNTSAGVKLSLAGSYTSNESGYYGGAVYAHANSAKLLDVTVKANTKFTGNVTYWEGGAIWAVNEGNGMTNVSVKESASFTNNLAMAGGAIFGRGKYVSYSSIVIDGTNGAVTFHNNQADGSEGGAIWTWGYVSTVNTNFTSNSAITMGGAIYTYYKVDITGGTFGGATAALGNTANYGGAIYIGSLGAYTSTITNTNFQNNTAKLRNYEAEGGAIWAGANSTLNVNGATFDGNSSAKYGGAIYALGTLTVGSSAAGRSEFYRNHAGVTGGAIYANATATVSGAKFGDAATAGSGNSADVHGGAIYTNGALTAQMDAAGTRSEFYRNTASAGGAINGDVGSSVTVTDAIFGDVNNAASGNSTDTSGGAIYAIDALTVSRSVFHYNTTVYSGGAIFAMGDARIDNSTFGHNTAGGNGGAINSDEMVVYNSTFYANSAENGGAFYNAGTLTLADVTLAANHAVDGGGIYQAGGTAYVFNTLLLANYLGSDVTALNDIQVDGGAFSMAYSIYQAANITLDSNGNTKPEMADPLKNIFGAKWNDAKTELVLIAGGANVLRADGTIAIMNTGLAAYSGTLVGKIGNDYFYRNGNTWESFSTVATHSFNTTGPDFGLGGSIIDLGQNVPASRIVTHIAYNVGAFALDLVPELPSVVVTTDSDEVNPFDYEISLREAVEVYAGLLIQPGDYWDTLTDSPITITTLNQYTVDTDITFKLIHSGGSTVITLDPLKGSITIGKNLTIDGHDILNNVDVTVRTEAGATHRLFTADDSAKDWVFEFSNMILNGGTTTLDGGAMYLNGKSLDVTIENIEFSGSAGENGGALYLNATEASLVAISDSFFNGNTATASGGAIYAEGLIDLNITDIDMTGNTAGSAGGAVYSEGKLTIDGISSFTGNSVIQPNVGISVYGGAIYAAGDLTVTGTATFTNNKLVSSGSKNAYGGAIYVGGVGTISGATFTGNTANDAVTGYPNGKGGAIYGNGKLIISDSVFNNNVSYNEGGAIYANDELELTHGEFYGNNSGWGGAILINNIATIIDSTFGKDGDPTKANYALEGGAIATRAETLVNDLTISGSSFFGNYAERNGGAISLGSNARLDRTLNITDSKFIGNHVTYAGTDTTYGNGGAIYVIGNETGAVINININGTTDFSGNTAKDGGAISVAGYLAPGAQTTVNINVATLANSVVTFTGNIATMTGGNTGGGAISASKIMGGTTINIGTGAGSKVTFTENKGAHGGAIYADNGYAGDTVAMTIGAGTSFYRNEATDGYGGAVSAYGASGTTVTIGEMGGDKVHFEGNTAKYDGGAVRANDIVEIYNSTFYDNHAGRNGGAMALFGTVASVKVEGSTFTENTAVANGGAIEVRGGSQVDIISTTFSKNTANQGGALYLDNSAAATMNLGDGSSTGGVVFDRNISTSNGGAVYANTTGSGNLTLNIVNGEFTNNKAGSSTVKAQGGAVYAVSGGALTVSVGSATGDVLFDTNTASHSGGAMYLKAGTAAALGIVNAAFDNNASTEYGYFGDGGAIMLTAGTSMDVNIGGVAGGTVGFDNNSAIWHGAALYLVGGTGVMNVNVGKAGSVSFTNNDIGGGWNGGAIGATSSGGKMTFDINGTFTNNQAGGDGGAIWIDSKGTSTDVELSLAGTYTNNNSWGSDGGAVWVHSEKAQALAVTVKAGTKFTGNTAYYEGGAIHAVNTGGSATVTVKEGATFTNNQADTAGAIYLRASTVNNSLIYLGEAGGSAVKFDGNKARYWDGGAIWTWGHITAVDTDFVSNSAGRNGGAIFTEYGTVNITDGSFGGTTAALGNKAVNGGAIYLNNGWAGTSTINGTLFQNNVATTGDGGAVWLGELGTLNVAGANFDNNKAAANGGAIYAAGTLMVSSSVTKRSEFYRNSAVSNGGAIYADATATVSVNGAKFGDATTAGSGNTATNSGGAIYAKGAVTVGSSGNDRSEFYRNNATLGSGGAIYGESTVAVTGAKFGDAAAAESGNTTSYGGGAIYALGALTVGSDDTYRSEFYRNSAITGGGAIFGYSTVAVTGAKFGDEAEAGSGNSAFYGGAIYAYDALTVGSSNNDRSEFYRNSATKYGGAIYGGVVTVTGAKFGDAAEDGSGNSTRTNTGDRGGAICASNVLTVGSDNNYRSEFYRNSSNDGGAIYGDSTVAITGAIFGNATAAGSGNTASSFGGAICAKGMLTVGSSDDDRSEFYRNKAGDGGAIYGLTSVTVTGAKFGDAATAGSGNSANRFGGAIYSTHKLTVDSDATNRNEFYRNNAGTDGGALYGDSTATVTGAKFGDAAEAGSGNSAGRDGGAFYANNTTVISGADFAGNIAGRNGGAIYKSTSGTFTISDSTVTGNFAGSVTTTTVSTTGGSGGGIWSAVSLTIDSSVTVSNNTARKNSTGAGGLGGGVYGSGTVTLNGATMSGNHADVNGGAVYGKGKVSVTDGTFTGNSADNNGGAIYGEGAVDVTRGVFTGNSALNGGAVYANGELMITHSEFRRNSALADGGAVYAAGTLVNMDNTLIADGSAVGKGGGIYLGDAAVAAVLTNLTIVNNAAADGGGIFTAGSNVRLLNSILWGNTVNQYAGLNNANVFNSGIQGWGFNDYATQGNVNLQAKNAKTDSSKNENAKDEYYVCFVDADNGNYHLDTGSYAINRGSNSYVVMPETDLDKNSRIDKGIVDMGAYESAHKGNVVVGGTGAHIIYGDSAYLTGSDDGYGGGGYSFTSRDTSSVTVDKTTGKATAVWADETVTIDVEYNGDDNWNSRSTQVTVTTEQRDLVIKATDATHTYDGANHNLNWNGDTSGYVLDDALESWYNAAYRNAGVYENDQVISDALITSSTRGDVTGNYRITYEGTLTINQAKLTITSDSDSFTYDGAYHDYAYGKSGLVNGDYIYSIVDGENSYRNAGSYTNTQSDAVIYNANGEDMSGNYEIVYNAGTVTVGKASLTITSDSGSFTYDGTYHDYAYGKSGLVNGDYIYSIVDGENSYRNAGSYTNTQSDAVIYNANGEDMSGNYEIVYNAGTVTVGKASLTITSDSGSFTYDGTYHDFGYGKNGLVTGDYIYSIVDGENSYRNAGSYTNTQSDAVIYNANGEDMSGNYEIVYNTGTVTVGKASLTITSDSGSFTYDGAYHDYAYGKSDLVNGDYIYSIVDGENSYRNAGSYTNTQSDAVIYNANGEDMSGNYEIVYNAGTVTVGKASLTITSDSDNRDYDGAYHNYAYGKDGLVVGDYIYSIVNGENSYRNAGSYTNTQSDAVIYNAAGEDMSGNYEIVYDAGTVVINKVTLTITAGSDHRTYDGKSHSYSWVDQDGLQGSDKITNATSNSFRNAGTYDNVLTNATVMNDEGTDASGNYIIKFVDGTVIIDKASLVINRDGADKVYDGTTDADYDWGFDVKPFEGDDVEYDKGTATFGDKNVGDDKPITIDGDKVHGRDLDNYDITFNDTTGSITPARLIIVIDDKAKTEGEADPKFTWTDNILDGDSVSGLDRTDKGEAVGKYGIDQYQVNDDNGGKNYSVEVHYGTLTITANIVSEARINIYMDASSRNYVINGMDEASLIHNVMSHTANREADAVLDTETSGNHHGVSHQSVTKAGEKGKNNLREDSQKKMFEEVDQQVVRQRTNSALKTDMFSEKDGKSSIVESQYKVSNSKSNAKVVVPVSEYGSQNTSFESDNPMHTMPSQITIESTGVNVVNFHSVDLADVVWTEKVDNLKDKLDIVLEDMMLV